MLLNKFFQMLIVIFSFMMLCNAMATDLPGNVQPWAAQTTLPKENPIRQDIQAGIDTAFMVTNAKNQMMQMAFARNQMMNEYQQEANVEKSRMLFLYSQNQHPIFLGCMTCGPISKYSTTNPYGPYGNKYGKFSIYNPNGKYGSNSSNYSPCNPNATYPPVIVNGLGVRYGLLTLNQRIFGAITDLSVLNSLKSQVCNAAS